MNSTSTDPGISKDIRFIPLSYNNADSQTSALRLILTLFPNWEHDEGKIEFIRFTDGITNTVTSSILHSRKTSTLIKTLAIESGEEEARLHRRADRQRSGAATSLWKGNGSPHRQKEWVEYPAFLFHTCKLPLTTLASNRRSSIPFAAFATQACPCAARPLPERSYIQVH